jgi:mono/diheme cytochrome c family protein
MIRTLVETLLALMLLGAIAALAGVVYVQHYGMSAAADPGPIETIVARELRHLAMPIANRERKNPVPATPENIHDGMAHFADHCAICHANSGVGDTEIGRNLYPKPPNMRLDSTQSLSDGEMFSIINNGVRLTGMPAFGDDPDHGEDDTWRLVLFIRHIPKLTKAELAEMEKLNPKSPAEHEHEHEHDHAKN